MYSSRRHRVSFLKRPETVIIFSSFYRPRVRSLSTLVTSSLTDSLAHSLLFSNLIDVTMACKDTDSKLFDVVTVADVNDEDRVGNSLLQISKLRFGQKANFLFRL